MSDATIVLPLVPPCEDCIHDKVCVIKANVEHSAGATLTMPALLPEIHPKYLGQQLLVDCDSFVDAEQYAAYLARREKAREAGRKGAAKLHRPVRVVAQPEPPDPDWAPLCMTDVDWTEWRRLNPKSLALSEAATRPCADCPADYAAEMLAVGKCNGQPGEVAA